MTPKWIMVIILVAMIMVMVQSSSPINSPTEKQKGSDDQIKSSENLLLDRKMAEEFHWDQYTVIAHALGGLDSFVYLNSKESFLSSYEKGCRLFEVDLTKTKDGIWVCRHSWTEPMGQWESENSQKLTWDEFSSRPLYGKYTPMSFSDFLSLLKDYPDAYILLDTKHYSVRNVQNTLRDFTELAALAQETGALDVMDRMIPEIYNEAMFPGAAMVHSFPAYLYSLWEEKTPEEIERIALFCRDHSILAAACSARYWNEQVQEIFDKWGILVYVYTVNEKNAEKEYRNKGAAGICTDWLFNG